jgi:cell division protein FtsB
MNFQQFIEKYEGTKVDWDGAFGAQCVDLFRQYTNDVVKVPQCPPVVGAKNIWDKIDTKYWEKIGNTPTGVPENGDVMIWDEMPGNRFGHVAMFIDGGSMRVRVFEQDGFTQDGAKKAYRNYNNIIGWLRPKENMSDCLIPNNPEGKKTFETLVTKSTQWDETVKYIWGDDRDPEETSSKDVQQYIGGLKSRITDLEKQLGKAQAEVKIKEDEISTLEGELLEKEEDIETLTTRLDAANSALKDCKDRCSALEIENAQLKERIKTLEEQCTNGEVTLTIGQVLKMILQQEITIKVK